MKPNQDALLRNKPLKIDQTKLLISKLNKEICLTQEQKLFKFNYHLPFWSNRVCSDKLHVSSKTFFKFILVNFRLSREVLKKFEEKQTFI